MRKLDRLSKLNEILEIPKELVSGVPKITLLGFEEMYIENYVGILEYEDFFIRINTKIGNININGFNLILDEMNEDNLKVIGKVENIDFEKRGITDAL